MKTLILWCFAMNLVIVEDSEMIRDQLVRIVGQQPRICIVALCSQEDEAVEAIMRLTPDTVLLDLSLAPGSGLQVLKRIRVAGCNCRVLVLTNNTDAAIQQACNEYGISGFFDKSQEAEFCLQHLYAWLPDMQADEGSISLNNCEMVGLNVLSTLEWPCCGSPVESAVPLRSVPWSSYERETKAEIEAQLHEFNLMLQQGDLTALERFAELRDAYGEKLASPLAAIDGALLHLDLEAALSHSQCLLASLSAQKMGSFHA
jgi:CheY-like chemotaxis protein